MRDDREILLAMLDRAGIFADIESEPPYIFVFGGGDVGFYTVFIFHEDGRLKAVEAYE